MSLRVRLKRIRSQNTVGTRYLLLHSAPFFNCHHIVTPPSPPQTTRAFLRTPCTHQLREEERYAYTSDYVHEQGTFNGVRRALSLKL